MFTPAYTKIQHEEEPRNFHLQVTKENKKKEYTMVSEGGTWVKTIHFFGNHIANASTSKRVNAFDGH